MAGPLLLPDYPRDLRDWSRTHPDLEPLHGQRVFLRVPEQPVFPLVRLLDVNTVAAPGDAPLWDARMAWYVWGGQPADYDAVSTLTRTLVSVLTDAAPLATGGTYIASVTNVAARDLPDAVDGAPRRVVDFIATLRALGASDF